MYIVIIVAIASSMLSVILTLLICRSRFAAREASLKAAAELADARLKALKETHAREIESLKETHSRLEEQQMQMFRTEREVLIERQKSLQQTNRQQISELLDPLKKQFDNFRQSVEETRTAGEVNKEELKNSFESTLRLFSQQQRLTVAALREQTEKIGNDAANLTRVLRRDSKAQGDWGEMILETLLESSGLQRDLHFFVQENVKDSERRNFRPDVVVRLPEGRSVIIDSKVSITAYADSFDAQSEAERKIKLREHARSVRRHIDELAAKKYDDLVSDSIGLVLMFIPNDQCYLSAIEQDKDLSRYAYSKGIVMISPSNLMIALQLAFNMWQQDRQSKNVEAIVRTATDLYEKTSIFSETIEEIGLHIGRLSSAFEKGRSQLFDGKGNLFRRIESLKELGITPKRKIKGIEED
ncbi:MAG: DNA recombination protein RmuC [Muribaculaceae bacterium]|nr:DNA recombination protein RmuC [Muribaculaceae bacterium]